jgi:hypothetical protein
MLPGQNGSIDESHLYVVDIDLKQPARAILTKRVDQRSRSFGWFAVPQFSPTNAAVYFLVPDWAAVTGGLFRIDLKSGGGRYDVFNMLEPSGDLNGVVGFTEEAVKRFLQEVDDDESDSKSGMQRR